MNAEQEIVKRLVERMEAVDWVAKLICFNEDGKAATPTKEAFWRHLVLSLLTSQQRSTTGSAVDLFERCLPFPLDLQTYESMKSDEEVSQTLRSFRFGKPVTRYLRTNHSRLFEKEQLWPEIQSSLEQLEQQRNSGPPDPSHKIIERKVARQLAGHLMGIGPKQSRNLLQWLGLTRYEIPLDSRVTGWLQENLGWYISRDGPSDPDSYEFWLDRLQSVCDGAGVLPTVFDAAAFERGKLMSTGKSLTTCIGYANRNGQVVIRDTGLPGTDHGQTVYQLGCSLCGNVYDANGSDIHLRLCPNCQGGAKGLPFEDA